MVALVFLLYALLVFEGALRKWVFPEHEQILYFIRMPFTLLLYWLAIFYRRWPRTTAPLFFVYVIASIAILFIPLQLFIGEYSQPHIMLAGYGWIMYFFYIPLAFLIGEQFLREDLDRLVRFTLWLAVVSAPLALMQFFSPPGSTINQGFGVTEESQFSSMAAALGHIRPTGLFTSTIGQNLFISSTAAFIVATLTKPPRFRTISPPLLWAGSTAVLTMLAVSGSRGMFANVAVILAFTAGSGVLTRRQSIVIRAAVWPFALVLAGAILWPILLPEGFEVFMERWENAWESETQRSVFEYGIFSRVFHGFYAFLYHLNDTPIHGYLLGIGSNAAQQLAWIQLPPAFYSWQEYGQWGEDSWSRHILDLGLILGLILILARIVLTVWLGLRTIQATRRNRDALSFILFGFLFFSILNGQIQGQGTLNGYAWMFFGFCLAATQRPRARTNYQPQIT